MLFVVRVYHYVDLKSEINKKVKINLNGTTKVHRLIEGQTKKGGVGCETPRNLFIIFNYYVFFF